MSYYILPKTNNIIDICPNITSNKVEAYTSCSLFNYYKEIFSQLRKLCDNDDAEVNLLLKLINPYEFGVSKVLGYKISTNKLNPNPKTNTFCDLIEMLNNGNLFDCYNYSIKSLVVTPNYVEVAQCIDLLRDNYVDDMLTFVEIHEKIYENIEDKKFEFIFFEIDASLFLDLNTYSLKMLEILTIVLKCQNANGVVIIKIDNIFFKPILDIIYIFTSLYEKTIIMKPNTSNIATFEKYLVCKKCTNDNEHLKNYYIHLIKNFIDSYKTSINLNNSLNISSIINDELSSHFINKIDDINIINGQQQLESINQIINVLKNKNKEDKIESIKKINIPKSVNWCEKMKVHCNKFLEKPNIFLTHTQSHPQTKIKTIFSSLET